jgi:hypothetical protein
VTNAARFLPFFMLSDMFMERAKEISVSSPSTRRRAFGTCCQIPGIAVVYFLLELPYISGWRTRAHRVITSLQPSRRGPEGAARGEQNRTSRPWMHALAHIVIGHARESDADQDAHSVRDGFVF